MGGGHESCGWQCLAHTNRVLPPLATPRVSLWLILLLLITTSVLALVVVSETLLLVSLATRGFPGFAGFRVFSTAEQAGSRNCPSLIFPAFNGKMIWSITLEAVVGVKLWPIAHRSSIILVS